MDYLHPIAGLVTLLLLVYVGGLGLRLRTARRDRARLAARHARLGPWLYALVLGSWAAGALSVSATRPDLAFADSLHFRSAAGLVLLLTGSAVTSRLMRRGNMSAREVHPWLGVAALLLAAIHLITGLRITP
ncbi:MAG: DUF4079 family protein [Candidatus Binatia bacterium]